uniref:Uncharacterized protein n=1 Tax=Pipistrellus kuhlii TaxID=59472 RepID=A0A7J7WLZ9_PIPKU|nr:hypothetical protein mPipKuh1_007972 [Pipistrellus kuhlii]
MGCSVSGWRGDKQPVLGCWRRSRMEVRSGANPAGGHRMATWGEVGEGLRALRCQLALNTSWASPSWARYCCPLHRSQNLFHLEVRQGWQGFAQGHHHVFLGLLKAITRENVCCVVLFLQKKKKAYNETNNLVKMMHLKIIKISSL